MIAPRREPAAGMTQQQAASRGAQGNLEFGWQSEDGVLYQLQTSATLHEDDWTDIGPPLPGDGGVLNATLPPGSEPANFARLKISR